jgi:hypothetical protein
MERSANLEQAVRRLKRRDRGATGIDLMRAFCPSLLALALLACSSEPAQQEAMEPENAATVPSGPPPPDADLNASLEEVAGLEAPPRFVGRWAAEERLCESAVWRFAERELRTPAGSVCRFTDVRSVPGGYDIAARCTAEAPERGDLLKLRFPESAGGMTFESETIADAGLVRCGDEAGLPE